ncbi:RDD family protein [Streptomyces sp. T-3]|nr:RDD family protein [Streptomyces sp. T-3]
MHEPRGNQQNPYAQNPYQQQPYGQQQFMPPAASQRRSAFGVGMAGEGRRYLAVTCDVLVTLGVLGLVGDVVEERYNAESQSGRQFLLVLGTLLAVSFVNHVVLTLMARASVGKLITGIRVVRAKDGGWPDPFRLIWRWLAGLCWLPLQPYYWLRGEISTFTGSRRVPRGTVRDSDDGEIYAPDLCGLRPVRRKDL